MTERKKIIILKYSIAERKYFKNVLQQKEKKIGNK